MPSGFKSLSEIINKEPALEGLRKIIKESDVVAEFNKIFPDLIKIAVPVKVEKKTLVLRVENAAWRNELKFRETQMVQNINRHFNEDRITRVRFLS